MVDLYDALSRRHSLIPRANTHEGVKRYDGTKNQFCAIARLPRPEQQITSSSSKAQPRGFATDRTSESTQRKRKTRGPKDRVFLKRIEKLSA